MSLAGSATAFYRRPGVSIQLSDFDGFIFEVRKLLKVVASVEYIEKNFFRLFRKNFMYICINLIPLHDLQLPLWSEESYANAVHWEGVSQQLKDSSAFVFITPEWDGMASLVNKNDQYIRNRIDFALSVLKEYKTAFEGMNTQLFNQNEAFLNGM